MDRAIEVFARGYCFTRSFTHPYLAERIGRVWVVRDAPRNNGDYRNEEWIAHGVAPAEMDRIARQRTRGQFAVCAIHGIGEPDEPLRVGFKSLGYRLMTTEPMMVHRLKKIPRVPSPASIERVTTMVVAEQLAKATRARPLAAEHLARDSRLRQYVARMDNKIVGWVRSIVVGDSTWCSSMYVRLQFRRRGIGRALLARMLRDDRTSGATLAVLLASHAGAKLYPLVGYEQIGTLLLFTPPKKKRNNERTNKK